jgi:N-acetylglutamate synthase-like GNAT family acetyltransferase
MKTTDGIEAVYLTTHNWGKAAKFFQALGFEPTARGAYRFEGRR